MDEMGDVVIRSPQHAASAAYTPTPRTRQRHRFEAEKLHSRVILHLIMPLSVLD